MGQSLAGKKVAILATHGFEQSELEQPLQALKAAGAAVDIVSPEPGRIRGWKDKNWGDEIDVDVPVTKADPYEYDGLVLPGGVMNPDQLRMDKDAVYFVSGFMESGKPVAAICHGPWTLIETGKLKGRRMTSYPSLRSDLENAGVLWEDSEVVTDEGLVTSRKPADLPAFCQKMIEEIGEGRHTAL
jgi:protease I